MPKRRDPPLGKAGTITADLENEAGQSARFCRAELVFLCCLGVTVFLFLWQLLSLPVFGEDGTVGSGLYPISLVSVLLLLLVLRAGRLVTLVTGTRQPPDSQAAAAEARPTIINRDQLVLGAFVLASVFLGYWTGLLIVVGIFLFAALATVERVGLRAALVFTAGMLVAVYLIFDLWLGMNVGLRGLF